MNDTTSTPPDPDGRGGVTTGEQAAVPRASQPGPVPRAPANGSTPKGPGANGQNGPAQKSPAQKNLAQKSAHTNGSTGPESGEPPVAEARPIADAAAAVPAPGSPAGAPPAGSPDPAAATGRMVRPGPRPEPAPPASDAPTTHLRLPASVNGATPAEAPPPVGGASAGPTSEADGAGPGVLPPPAEPFDPDSDGPARPSTSGAVPGPGPAAAAPPPWNRVPGQEPPPAPAPPSPGPAGGLLDDGPTTFVEAPSRPADAPTPNRGWTSARPVRNRPPRQAALQLKRLDPWSVLKLALVLAVVIFFTWLVAVGVLYGVLDGMGVWDRLNGTYADLVSGEAPAGSPLISAGRVFGLAAVIGAINSLLFAVAATIGAFVYNVSTDLVGGIEVTLSERD